MKEITSLAHPVVQHLVKLKKSKAYRQECGSLLLEGNNCISDVLQKHKAKRLLVTAKTTLQADEVLLVNQTIIDKISNVKSPDNMLAELSFPQEQDLTNKNLIVALDGVQDPGNLGTIIRTALALGWQGIFLLEPCCDAFNDKALRAAKGATFDIALQKGSWNDLQKLIQKGGHLPLVADLEGNKPEAYTAEEKLVLILGNEAHGVALPCDFRHKKVSIPMSGQIESLNVAVAAGILLYCIRKGQGPST